jgi:D-glycero-D-manno-heptose 1,7-bisphosphate phosphatase
MQVMASSTAPTRPAIFLDRDGVLNRDIGYVHRPEQIEWIDGAREAVKACNDAGALVFVVSNQSGVARGYYDEAAVEALHAWMNDQLALLGAHVDAFEYCPHHEQGSVERYRRQCRRRKPAPGMILDLLQRWPIDRSRSLLVGDQPTDIAAGQAAGIDSVLFPGGNLRDFLVPLLEPRRISQ